MRSAARLSAGLTTTALLAGLGAGVLAAAAPAGASTHAVHRTFAARGLIVSRSAHSMTVLARTLKTGSSVRHNAIVKVAVPARGRTGKALTGRLHGSSVGDTVSVTGIASGTGRAVSFAAHKLAGHSTPFHAYLGVVTAARSTSLQVVKADLASDDPSEDSVGVFNVDTSNAVVTVDGTAGTPAAGELVAVLGSQADDNIVATSVWAFSSVPDVVGGTVTGVNGTVVTVADRLGDDNGDDNPSDDNGDDNGDDGDTSDNGATDVDLASAALVLNGASSSTPDQLTNGTRIIALGTTDAATGTFSPELALAFSRGCSSRHHGDGGKHGHGDHGGGDDNGGDNGAPGTGDGSGTGDDGGAAGSDG